MPPGSGYVSGHGWGGVVPRSLAASLLRACPLANSSLPEGSHWGRDQPESHVGVSLNLTGDRTLKPFSEAPRTCPELDGGRDQTGAHVHPDQPQVRSPVLRTKNSSSEGQGPGQIGFDIKGRDLKRAVSCNHTGRGSRPYLCPSWDISRCGGCQGLLRGACIWAASGAPAA